MFGCERRRRAGLLPAWLFLILGIAWPATVRAAEAAPPPVLGHPGEVSPRIDDTPVDQEGDDQDYYELFKLIADTLDQVERNYVKEISRRQLVEAAIRGMLSELDQYSSYIPPKQLDRFRSGVEAEFGGVGVQVTIDEGKLRVISPIVGSPAYREGMMAGDVIMEINGTSAEGISIDEAIELMKGKPGTDVAVKVQHPGADAPRTLTLTREVIRVETVLADARNDDATWNWMYDETRKIGYIRVTAFGRNTADELGRAIRALTDDGVRGLVLDLRFNPGGLLSSAIEVSDLFVGSGRIVSTAGRNTPGRSWDARRKGTLPDFPMAILVNRYSASASEIVAACLQDHGRAVVIGERTWGKGSVQNVVELEEGASALKLTTADYRRPNGKNIHRFPGSSESDDWGVSPDEGYEVKLTPSEVGKLMARRRQNDIVRRAGDEVAAVEDVDMTSVDRQLAKALEHLSERLDQLAAKAEEAEEEKEEVTEPDDTAAAEDGEPD